MSTFHNRARMSTATTGTGTITLGTAHAAYASFAEAGVANGDRVSYVLEDGNNFEVGQGVYSSSGTTLSRLKILLSKVSGQAADTSPISLSGSATVFLTATAESLRDLGPHFSVNDYGAVGDGSTNDHVAIQAAVDAAEASLSIKRVYIPDPSVAYTFGDTVTIPAGVVVFGDNRKGLELSRCKPAVGFTDPLFESDDYGNSRVLRIGIEGLFIDGSSTTLTAIRANAQESVFRDNTIKNCFTYGLHLGGVGSGPTQQALNNQITNNYLAGTISTTEFYDGIFVDYNSADNTIRDNYVEASKDAGIRSRGYNNKITNNHIYSVSGTSGGAGIGIYTETSADHDISSNYIELTAAEAILMAGGGSDVATLAGTVHGNVCRNIDTGNTSNGVIEISGSDVSALTVFGNIVRRDAATSYATPYFVYFNGITPTRAKVFGNEWQANLITTAETNVTLPFEVGSVDATSVATDAVELGEFGTMLTEPSAGDVEIDGNIVYRAGGTDVPVADGGSGRSDATAYAVICGGTTSTAAHQSIASVGSAGQVLTSNGAGALPTFQPVGAGSVNLLASGTVSSAAALDLVLTSYTAYRGLVVELSGLVPQTDGVDLFLRTSTDGGSNYDAGASDYSWATRREGETAAGANAGDVADNEMQIIGVAEIGNASSEGINVTVKLMAQTSAALWSRACWQAAYLSNAAPSAINEIHGAGVRRAAQDTDAIRFLFSSGNIASGSYAIYGLS